MSESTVGLLALLSTLNFYAPVSPAYMSAANAAGRAAFIQSGGQALQDKLTSISETRARRAIYWLGISDTQIAVLLGTAKVINDKQLALPGPRFYQVNTSFSVAPEYGSVGLSWGF